ncbi:ArsI/CadI family heavy metal resistance metalloenzyme [Streptomyces sp. NPDC056367]|uniref:ArsI/CadI family heavy metal resistance metalloenzyme n=1 Tax=Streptomyces sp. NPDC056367 TaxID=3345797 RepID=UPI0035D74770
MHQRLSEHGVGQHRADDCSGDLRGHVRGDVTQGRAFAGPTTGEPDREGYANFAITEPPLKPVLIEGGSGEDTRLDHLGVQVASTADVTAAATRLQEAGLATFEESDTSCCYALRDKVWVTGPGREPWEVYVVKADADTLGGSAGSTPGAGCACGS